MYGMFSERILDRLEGTMSGSMHRLSASLLGNDTDGITSSLTDLFEHVVSGGCSTTSTRTRRSSRAC